MNQANLIRPFKTKFLQIAGLNLAAAIALGFAFWIFQNTANRKTLPEELISSLITAAIYGTSFGFAMPYLAERFSVLRAFWKWVLIIASLLTIAFVSTLIVELSLLGLGNLSIEEFRGEYFFKSLGVFFIALIIGLGIYIYETFREHIQATNLKLKTQELEKERALKLATEAELASLKSKLHPHFLFNTLNSISALISEDPLLADKMVQRLATLLRTSLDACEQNSVSLGDEIKLVADYLEIEKARFRERLFYEIDVAPEIAAVQIPPLILQPIVENSVKFAVSPNPAGGKIKISGRREKEELILEVRDDGHGFSIETLPGGHGLDNLQMRLKNLFGEKANLIINSQNGKTIVTVSLPFNGLQETK